MGEFDSFQLSYICMYFGMAKLTFKNLTQNDENRYIGNYSVTHSHYRKSLEINQVSAVG